MSSKIEDENRAVMMLEKSVLRAKSILENEQKLKPFAMILYDDGSIKTIHNQVKDPEESYALLQSGLKIRVKEGGVDIIVLLIDTIIPERFSKVGILEGIRVHIEEKSKENERVGARFLYVPYQLCKTASSNKIFADLYPPVPMSFPAEFILFKENK
jgi:hypothetical protein